MRPLLAAAAAAAAVTAATLAPGAGAAASTPASTSAAYPRWKAMSDGPLSSREHATAVWTGKEVLIFGGDRYPCAPNAKCVPPSDPPRSDGAAYDPRADRWHKIADAPLPVPHASTAVLGRYVYALIEPDYNLQTFAPQHQTFARYDTVADTWKVLPRPQSEFANLALVAVGADLIAYQAPKSDPGDRDFLWDAKNRSWSELPVHKAGPFDARVMIAVGGDAVVFGTKPGTPAGAGRPVPTIAARLDLDSRTWRSYKPSTIAADAPFWWSAAGLAVNATPGTAGAYALGGILDARTGRWGRLPNRPAVSERPGVTFDWAQAGGGNVVVSGRQMLDATSMTWRQIGALPELRGYLQGPSVVWAGDRLLVWGGAMFPDGTGPKGLRDAGWTWSPSR